MKPKHTFLAALLCGISQAQTTDSATPEKKPEGDAQALGEMVVTAERSVPDVYRTLESEGGSRLPMALMDLPQAVQVVPHEVIENQAITRASEALRNVSGVVRTPAYMGFTDSYTIRGFQSDTGLWNGFRRDLYIGFNDISAIDRIEVIKGPSSVSYGILDPGGVVNYVTKRPTSVPYGKVEGMAGSYDFYRSALDVSGPLTEDKSVRYRFNAAYESSGGFRDFTDSDLQAYSGAVDWDINEKTKMQFEFSTSDFDGGSDRGLSPEFGPMVYDIPIHRNYGEPTDSYKLRQVDVALSVTHELSEDATLRSGVFFNQVESDRKNTQGFSLAPGTTTLLRNYTDVEDFSRVFSWYGDLRYKFETGPLKHDALVGVDLQRAEFDYVFQSSDAQDIDIWNPVYGKGPITLTPDGDYYSTRDSMGIYVQDHITITEQWKALAGLRWDTYRFTDKDKDYDTYTDFHDNGVSPRAALVYQPVKEVSIYGSYSQSIKPNTYARTKGGAIVDPEEGQQIEFGVKTELLDGRLTPSLAVYDLRKKNVAVQDPTDPSGMFSVITGEQRSRGVELDLTATLAPGWNMIASYGYTDSEVTEDTSLPIGDALVNVPLHGASFSTTYEIQEGALKGAGVTASAFYVGQREASLPNDLNIPSYVRLDAGVFYKMDQWRFSVDVKNVTDKEYYDSQGYSLYPGAPLSVFAGVSYTW